MRCDCGGCPNEARHVMKVPVLSFKFNTYTNAVVPYIVMGECAFCEEHAVELARRITGLLEGREVILNSENKEGEVSE